MLFSIININKPKGITSHDVVAQCRKIFGLKKVGHLGTLDPMATGVLPVALGQATRLIEYFPDNKRYMAEITLGQTTTTDDAEGEVLEKKPAKGITQTQIIEALKAFEGEIQQQVPLYSAVHVGGKKLYKIARSGQAEDIKLPVKTVTISEISLLDFSLPTLSIDVACSSGTYIRSIARDLGKALGCGGHLSGLVRTQHGQFVLDDAVTLDTLKASDNPQQYLQAPAAFLGLPRIPLDEATCKQLENGMKITLERPPVKLTTNRLYLAERNERPVSVVMADGGKLKPVKVFPEN